MKLRLLLRPTFILCALYLVPWCYYTFYGFHYVSLDFNSSFRHVQNRPWRTDTADDQWTTLRRGLLPLTVGLSVYVLISRLLGLLSRRLQFCWKVVSGVGFVFALHGCGAVWVTLLISPAYLLTFFAKWRWLRVFSKFLLWAYCIFLIIWMPSFDWNSLNRRVFGTKRWYAYSGMYRFWIGFNLMVLKMISFTMDYFKVIEDREMKKDESVTRRIDYSLIGSEHFTFSLFLVYCFYPPLYIAGPTISFETFALSSSGKFHDARAFEKMPLSERQTRSIRDKTEWIRLSSVIRYLFLRLLVAWVCLEVWLHLISMPSILREHRRLGLSSLQYIFLARAAVCWIYVKFNFIWKFFRFFAIADGVAAVENMPSCFGTFAGPQEFWRGWHASFNLFNIKYLYLPLGGSRWQFLNLFPIFFFVAVWHDGLHTGLLVWAGLMIFLFMLELLWQSSLEKSRWAKRHPWWAYFFRCLRAGVFLDFFTRTTVIGFVGLEDGGMMFQSWLSWRMLLFSVFQCTICMTNIHFTDTIRDAFGTHRKSVRKTEVASNSSETEDEGATSRNE